MRERERKIVIERVGEGEREREETSTKDKNRNYLAQLITKEGENTNLESLRLTWNPLKPFRLTTRKFKKWF